MALNQVLSDYLHRHDLTVSERGHWAFMYEATVSQKFMRSVVNHAESGYDEVIQAHSVLLGVWFNPIRDFGTWLFNWCYAFYKTRTLGLVLELLVESKCPQRFKHLWNFRVSMER